MRVTIDKAGRLVIPKHLRDQVGLHAGEVNVSTDGNALRVEALAAEDVEDHGGRLVIPASGASLGDDEVQALRDGDQS